MTAFLTLLRLWMVADLPLPAVASFDRGVGCDVIISAWYATHPSRHVSAGQHGGRVARDFWLGAVPQGIGGALIFNPVLLQLTVNPQARLPICLSSPAEQCTRCTALSSHFQARYRLGHCALAPKLAVYEPCSV